MLLYQSRPESEQPNSTFNEIHHWSFNQSLFKFFETDFFKLPIKTYQIPIASTTINSDIKHSNSYSNLPTGSFLKKIDANLSNYRQKPIEQDNTKKVFNKDATKKLCKLFYL